MSNRAAWSEQDSYRRRLDYFDDDLYLINADGTGLRNLTEKGPSDIRSQDWSADGRRFVLFSWDSDINVIDADGSNFRHVYTTTPYFQVRTVAWSPDGRRILFTEYQEGRTIPTKADMSVINVNGSNRRVLTRNLHDSQGTFSPDGSKIAFVRYAGGREGSEPVRLSKLLPDLPDERGRHSQTQAAAHRPDHPPRTRRRTTPLTPGHRTGSRSPSPAHPTRQPISRRSTSSTPTAATNNDSHTTTPTTSHQPGNHSPATNGTPEPPLPGTARFYPGGSPLASRGTD